MDAERRPPTVIFLHLPKTAGTTLNDVIRRQYEPEEIHTLTVRRPLKESLEKLRALSVDELRRIRLLRGPVGFGHGLHEILPGPCTYTTLLRHPVDRVASHHEHVRARVRDRAKPYVNRSWLREAAEMSLVEYAAHAPLADARNGQTKMLAGVVRWWLDPVDEEPEGGGAGESDLLDTAISNIEEHFAVVGLTEHFDESLLLMADAFGWDAPYYVSQNVRRTRPRREQITREERRVIEEHNELDLALYDFVRERLERAVEEVGHGFESRVARFQALNPVWGTYQGLRRIVFRTAGRLGKTGKE